MKLLDIIRQTSHGMHRLSKPGGSQFRSRRRHGSKSHFGKPPEYMKPYGIRTKGYNEIHGNGCRVS